MWIHVKCQWILWYGHSFRLRGWPVSTWASWSRWLQSTIQPCWFLMIGLPNYAKLVKNSIQITAKPCSNQLQPGHKISTSQHPNTGKICKLSHFFHQTTLFLVPRMCQHRYLNDESVFWWSEQCMYLYTFTKWYITFSYFSFLGSVSQNHQFISHSAKHYPKPPAYFTVLSQAHIWEIV